MSYTMTAPKRILACVIALAVAFTMALMPALASAPSAHAASLKTTCTKVVKKSFKGSSKSAKIKSMAKYMENKCTYASLYKMEKVAKVGGNGTLTNTVAKKYAKTFMSQKQGSCYHYAAAFAFLLKKAFPKATVRIGYSSNVTMPSADHTSPHAWTEVKLGGKWYVCDINMDDWYSGDSDVYGGDYACNLRSKVKSIYGGFKGAKYVKVSF